MPAKGQARPEQRGQSLRNYRSRAETRAGAHPGPEPEPSHRGSFQVLSPGTSAGCPALHPLLDMDPESPGRATYPRPIRPHSARAWDSSPQPGGFKEPRHLQARSVPVTAAGAHRTPSRGAAAGLTSFRSAPSSIPRRLSWDILPVGPALLRPGLGGGRDNKGQPGRRGPALGSTALPSCPAPPRSCLFAPRRLRSAPVRAPSSAAALSLPAAPPRPAAASPAQPRPTGPAGPVSRCLVLSWQRAPAPAEPPSRGAPDSLLSRSPCRCRCSRTRA